VPGADRQSTPTDPQEHTGRVPDCLSGHAPQRQPAGPPVPVPLHLPVVGPGAAFFDLDKTVIAKSSALAFGRPFFRDGLITRRDVIKAAYAQLVFKIGGADEQQMARIRDQIAKLCTGWSVEQVSQIVNETLHELIHPYVYAEAAALIEEHQAAGRDVVLVSASGIEIVRPIGELLGTTDIIATRMVVRDGRYTGEVAFYAAGEQKVAAVRELAQARGYDLAESYAYSDSVTDAPLLAAVGHPTAVNPDRGLRRVAAERRWPVLEFRHPIPLGRRLRDRPVVPVAAAALGLGIGVAIGVALYGRRRRARMASRAAAEKQLPSAVTQSPNGLAYRRVRA
jgi:HAD superfamily hydrolase (TIGR01490 family)